MSVIRNTEVTVIRSQLCNTSNGHASGTPANRPYNGGVRNSEARNIEVPLYIYMTNIFLSCTISVGLALLANYTVLMQNRS